MALYAIGDLHLSLASNKSMEVFGEGWKDYVSRIDASLGALGPEDVLVLAGDTSWGMTLAEAEADFRFLDQFPCREYWLKGTPTTGGPLPPSSAASARKRGCPHCPSSIITVPFTGIMPSAAPGAGSWRRMPTTGRS